MKVTEHKTESEANLFWAQWFAAAWRTYGRS